MSNENILWKKLFSADSELLNEATESHGRVQRRSEAEPAFQHRHFYFVKGEQSPNRDQTPGHSPAGPLRIPVQTGHTEHPPDTSRTTSTRDKSGLRSTSLDRVPDVHLLMTSSQLSRDSELSSAGESDCGCLCIMDLDKSWDTSAQESNLLPLPTPYIHNPPLLVPQSFPQLRTMIPRTCPVLQRLFQVASARHVRETLPWGAARI